ncbi:MAG: methylmalonyl-CoA carboxyltransferase [Myxococcaceae bacterium]|nr:methylmalonyl-CoA carboxyltransferase [Myxococcaceae bacterium]
MAEPTLDELLTQVAARDARAFEGGGRARLDRQRRLGRLTARERGEQLVGAGSFVELERHVLHRHSHASEQLATNVHAGDGIVAGLGTIAGQTVCVYAHDPTVLRGALGREGARKVCRVLDLAAEKRAPVIALADSDGVRVEEGTDAIGAYGEIIRRSIRLKGRVPQLTLICGLCVGAAAYAATLTDGVGMIEGQSWFFITGPKVTKVVTGEDVTLDQLGAPALHAKKTGACHAVLKSEAEGLAWLRALLAAMKPAVVASDPADRATPELQKLVPASQKRAYDMRKVLSAVFDEGSVLELSAQHAQNLVTAFGRLGGRAVAIVASNPLHLAGCLDIDASRKGATFVTWAAQLGLPVVTLVDVPGYLPGRKQEEGGIIPHGATLLTAYGNANVPLVCLIVRKSYGGASVLSFAAGVRLALPTARVGPMGADATIEVVLGPEPKDPDEKTKAVRAAKREAFLAANDHAWAAAESGYVDRVIAFADARRALCKVIGQVGG